MSVEILMPKICIDWWNLIKVAKNHLRTYMGMKINKKLDKGPFIYYVITCKGKGVRKCQFLIIFSTKKYASVGGAGVQKS